MIPKPHKKELPSCCLLVKPNESRLREQPPSNGNVYSCTFIRQGLSEPQSAKECSPVRKEKPSLKCKNIGGRNWSCEVMSTSHPGGKKTTKCQGSSGGCYMKIVLARHMSMLQATLITS